MSGNSLFVGSEINGQETVCVSPWVTRAVWVVLLVAVKRALAAQQMPAKS